MNTSRVLVASIILSGIVYVAGFVALGNAYPDVNSSGEEIVAWFTDNASSARFYAWTSTFMALGLAIFGAIVAKTPAKTTKLCLLCWCPWMVNHRTSPSLVLGPD